MTTSNTINGATYKNYEVLIGKTQYNVMVVTGKYNYINVRKVTSNHFGVCGKDFQSFDQAVSHYKNRQMKIELLKIEMGLA